MMIQLLGIAVNGTIAVTCGYLTASNIIEGRKARQTDEELKKLFEAAAADREVYKKAVEVAANSASLAAASGRTGLVVAHRIASLKVQATKLADETVAAAADNDALRARLEEESRQAAAANDALRARLAEAAAANAKLQAQLGAAQTEAAEIERLGQEALTKAAEEARILRARLESNAKLKDSMLAKLGEAKAEVEALEAQNLDTVLAIEALDAAIDPEPRPVPGNPNGKSFGRPAKPAPKAKA